MKEIRMDYSEYEKMVQIIKTQQETIERLKTDSRVVLVDDRFDFNPRLDCFNGRCPKVIADEKLAKEYLQEEFDNLSKDFHEWSLQYIRETNESKVSKKKWCWSR